ncbi:hypothetical protein KRP22_000788 [Phytophthora ramorum]|nr:hypothetical protein KRP22_475 [Phytophthora ramorum]
MVDRNGSNARTREKSETKVHVVTSRYALALQRRNQKLRSGSVDARKKSLNNVGQIDCAPGDFDATRAPSRTVTNRNASAAHLQGRRKAECSSIEQQKQSRNVVFSSRRATIDSSGLHTKPRPAFPTRISTPTGKKINQAEIFVVENGDGSGEDACSTRYEQTEMINAKSTEANVSSELSEVELLENMHYQLYFAAAKAENTFRRQEQRAEDQMLAAWDILQSKLQHLQEASLHLDRQRRTVLIENHVENLLPDQLPSVLDSISQMCTSLEAALNRHSCSGLKCTNPLLLKQHVEALSLGFDTLLEHIEASHVSDAVSRVTSFDHDMRRLSAKSSTALLQAAHLFTKLAVESIVVK